MIEFTPLKNRVAIKRDEKEEKTLDSGIVLPEEAQKTPQEGTILAIGADVKDVSVGDRVMFGLRDGQMHTINGEKVLILREDALWGVLDA